MSKTIVVNVKKEPKGSYVYIGRGSILGNPFVMKSEADRDTVIRQYLEYAMKRMRSDEQFREAIAALQGRRIGCFCAPKACHGDVLIALLDRLFSWPEKLDALCAKYSVTSF